MTQTLKPYFEKGNVAIYLGDCREIVPQLGQFEYVITDPPYAVNGSRAEWRTTASVGTGIHLAAKVVKKGGAMVCFTTTSGRGIEYTLGAVGGALPFNRLLIWHKSFVRSRVAGPWRWDAVSILAFGRASFGRPEASSVFTSTGPASKKHLGSGRHPAELPDGIAEWIYAPLVQTQTNIAVLDPFVGTGQLLVPAVLRGHRAVGIDLEERYCEMAARRLEGIEPIPFPIVPRPDGVPVLTDEQIDQLMAEPDEEVA